MLSTIRASAKFTEELDNILFLSISSEKEEYERRAKEIRARSPVPYGTIPKRKPRRRRKSSLPAVTEEQQQSGDTHSAQNNADTKNNNSNNNKISTAAAAATIQAATASTMTRPSLLSSIISFLFPSKPEPPKCVGFLPRTQPTVDVATSPLEVLAPPGKSMSESSTSDDCTILSTSSSSTSSLSSLSTLDDVADASSMTALSDILCDYYFQTRCSNKEVPLETFGVFEASTLDDCNACWLGQEEAETKNWRRIDQHTDNSVDTKYASPSLAETPIVEPEIMIENTPMNLSDWRHPRDVRDNSAHYRMIVAEINMMRSNKIICPLRQRMYLPKRADEFEYRPSPLKQKVLAY